MGNGYCGILMQQQHGHGFAHNVAAPQHHRPLAGQVRAGGMDQFHHPGRGAGQKTVVANHNSTHILRVEGVYILGRINTGNHLFVA